MIDSSEDKIKIFSSTNTIELKIRVIILVLGCILSIYKYFTAHAYNLAFLIATLFIIIIIYFCLKSIKQKNIQILECEITKESIKFYKKQQIIEYKYSDLESVSYDPLSINSSNEIFVNYYDNNKKLKTAIHFITGCNKITLVDIVNSMKIHDENIEKNN